MLNEFLPLDPTKALPALLQLGEMDISVIRVEGRTHLCLRVLGVPPVSVSPALRAAPCWLFT